MYYPLLNTSSNKIILLVIPVSLNETEDFGQMLQPVHDRTYQSAAMMEYRKVFPGQMLVTMLDLIHSSTSDRSFKIDIDECNLSV